MIESFNPPLTPSEKVVFAGKPAKAVLMWRDITQADAVPRGDLAAKYDVTRTTVAQYLKALVFAGVLDVTKSVYSQGSTPIIEMAEGCRNPIQAHREFPSGLDLTITGEVIAVVPSAFHNGGLCWLIDVKWAHLDFPVISTLPVEIQESLAMNEGGPRLGNPTLQLCMPRPDAWALTPSTLPSVGNVIKAACRQRKYLYLGDYEVLPAT